ncbi:hypothetical protein EBZ39_00230 [bacterium]|nr:hypothetical protein [bacterium]
MAHGTPKGKIDAVFEKRIKDLEKSARSTADTYKSGYTQYRKWATPEGVSNLWHVPSLHMPTWDRFEINKLYSADILNGDPQSGGTCADLIAMKLQNDFLASEERAFRLRHASYTRCGAMAHGRFDGQGKEGESSFSFIKDSIKEILEAGKQ